MIFLFSLPTPIIMLELAAKRDKGIPCSAHSYESLFQSLVLLGNYKHMENHIYTPYPCDGHPLTLYFLLMLIN